MILKEKQRLEFETVARPVIKWLNDNCHPHVTVILTPGGVTLTEGVCFIPIDDYILD